MTANKGEDCSCPNCGEVFGPVEKFAVEGQDIPHINDCSECGETFEVRDNQDGTFNVTA